MNYQKQKYDDGRTYTISFSMISNREYDLIVNAIKRQVDYYRNKVFNSKELPISEFKLIEYKTIYKTYNDLYNKIINDYQDVVKCA